jgi:hypothetical protein
MALYNRRYFHCSWIHALAGHVLQTLVFQIHIRYDDRRIRHLRGSRGRRRFRLVHRAECVHVSPMVVDGTRCRDVHRDRPRLLRAGRSSGERRVEFAAGTTSHRPQENRVGGEDDEGGQVDERDDHLQMTRRYVSCWCHILW